MAHIHGAAPPNPADLFSDAKSPDALVTKFDRYQECLTKSLNSPVSFSYAGDVSPVTALHRALGDAELSKSVAPDTIESIRESLNADAVKDLNLAGPGATGGLQAIDLSGPAKELAPKMTPIRNRMPRVRGIGRAHVFKRITGFSNTGTGVAELWPGISETTTTQFGGVNYVRGPKIGYAGDQQTVPYFSFSESNSVSWQAEFAGYGFQDIRQLAMTTLLYSSMLAEEKMMIFSRGTVSPFVGAFGAPTGVTVTSAAPGTGQTATTGVTSKVWAFVTAATPYGESPISAAGNASWSSGQLSTVSWTPIAGAYQYKVYVGTGSSDPGAAAYFYQGTTSATSYPLQGAVVTSGTAASTVNVGDSTAFAGGYDGILAQILGPNSGAVNRVNGPLSAANPGDEIQKVCGALFESRKANPDEVLCNGYDRKQLSDLLKTSSGTNYSIAVMNRNEAHDATIGTLVTGIQNEITGKLMPLTMCEWWPQSVMGVVSWSLPVPDSNVSNVWEIVGPQDFMSVEWPQTQFTYDSSTYWQNALVCYAPEFNGAVTGITRA